MGWVGGRTDWGIVFGIVSGEGIKVQSSSFVMVGYRWVVESGLAYGKYEKSNFTGNGSFLCGVCVCVCVCVCVVGCARRRCKVSCGREQKC